MIPVGRLAPGDQWDQNLLDRLFANELYPTGLDFTRVEGYPPKTGGVLLIPGRYWAEDVPAIEDAIASHEWVLGIRTSDEEDLFDVTQVAHPNIRWWVQTPRPGRDYPDGTRFIPIGFPPHFNDLPKEPPDKALDVFLSAQNTHERRHLAFDALAGFDGIVQETAGFTQGLAPDIYRANMAAAKAAPCPSGAVCQDTFRVWEALESHAVPVVDAVSPTRGDDDFWPQLLGLYHLDTYWGGPELANDVRAIARAEHPGYANRVVAWWMRHKRTMADWLVDDLTQLGAL